MSKLPYILITTILCLFLSCQRKGTGMTKTQRIDIFEQIWGNVNQYYYDADFNGVDWDKKRVEYRDRIARISSIDSLFLVLNQMLFELNSSHCGVGLLSELHKDVSPYVFSNGETGIDIRLLEKQIVVTNVLTNSSADIANIKTGYIIAKIDGYTLSDIEKEVGFKPPFNNRNRKFHLTAEVLRRIYGKAGTKVNINFTDDGAQTHTVTLIRTERLNRIDLGGGLPPAFLKSESYFISDDIAYLTFNAFSPADLGHVLEKYKKVSKSKGLIIDLRGNDGGSIEGMKLLLGRFVSERRMYGTYINRHEKNIDFINPVGNKYQGKVMLLVDEMSISGAENMAGIFQQLNIGKVIGNKTPGQMLWGNGYLINDTIALSIPIYKLEYINGFNPEKNGITPDVQVRLKREDLLKGRDTQLEYCFKYLSSTF